MDYYQEPSRLALPIIKLLVGSPNPSGECRRTIYFLEQQHDWGFNRSSALKYLWRLGAKSADTQSDLAKAIQYLEWELEEPRSDLSFEEIDKIELAIEMCRELQLD